MEPVSQHPPVIKFTCKCGHRFAAPLEQAAGTVQCPDCGLLCDIPTLSDLASLEGDGTLRMAPAKPRVEPHRIDHLAAAFTRERLDGQGSEIDLRPSQDDLERIDSDAIPLKPREQALTEKPKYDPVTGELIRPIGVDERQVPEAHTVPVAKRALSYASGDLMVIPSAGRALRDLFSPINMVVMLFILLLHLFNQISIFAVMGGLFLLAPSVVLFTALILAHYANVVDETGPEARDELPRPIRGVSFGDDIWRPFTQAAGAMLICFVPAHFFLAYAPPGPATLAVYVVLLGAGTFFFPAILLTLVTSGTIVNLRPDRVISVIRVIGGRYIISLLCFVLSAAGYWIVLQGTVLFVYRLMSRSAPAAPLVNFISHPAFLYPALMIVLLVAHYFCWHLGLLYRRYHDHFPWVMQHHISIRAQAELEKAAQLRAQRRKPHYVQKNGGA